MGTLIRAVLPWFALLPLASAPASAQRREPVWPIASGVHDVLHSFQNPFDFGSRYFHEGVDLRSDRRRAVVAMRSGIVRYVSQQNVGGTLLVEVQTPHGVEADSYLHVRLDPWLPGDVIRAGERVGLVSNNYFARPLQDHVHVNRFRGPVAGSGYIFGLTNMLNPLAIFGAARDRDPLEEPPRPADANEDGSVFWIAPKNDPTTRLPSASGAVELLVEATDRQSQTLYFAQGLLGIGYWIESLARGDDVASAEKPYRLLRFDDAWRSSHPNCDQLVNAALLVGSTNQVEFGPDNTTWTMLANYRLTRAAGFRGRCDEISAAQAWHTDVRRGTGLPNGTGGMPSRDPQEARFPDGAYRVHVLTEDLLREVDTTFEILVDNFQPIVESLRAVDATHERELGLQRRVFDPIAGTTELVATATRPVRVGARVRLELELSEPMSWIRTVALEPALGPFTAWTSSQEATGRTRFQAELSVVSIPDGASSVRLALAGSDLTGRLLAPVGRARPIAVPTGRDASRSSEPLTLTLPVTLDGRRSVRDTAR